MGVHRRVCACSSGKSFPVFPKIKATRGEKEIEVLDGVDSDNIGGKTKKQTASGSLIKPFAT